MARISYFKVAFILAYLIVCLWLTFASGAKAQSTVPVPADPTYDAISRQLGQLLIANAQCGGQIKALSDQSLKQSQKIEELQKKLTKALALCGDKCASEGDTPAEVEKKLEGAE